MVCTSNGSRRPPGLTCGRFLKLYGSGQLTRDANQRNVQIVNAVMSVFLCSIEQPSKTFVCILAIRNLSLCQIILIKVFTETPFYEYSALCLNCLWQLTLVHSISLCWLSYFYTLYRPCQGKLKVFLIKFKLIFN